MTITSPSSLLASSGCEARVLNLSDQHVVVLLRTASSRRRRRRQEDADDDAEEKEEEEERSLLKLTVIPEHRRLLSSNTGSRGDDDDDTTHKRQQQQQRRLLSFLRGLEYSLTSESGAEYSYYDAVKKKKNDDDGFWNKVLAPLESWVRSLFAGDRDDEGDNDTSPSSSSFRVELISPASDRQIQRATPASDYVMVEETPALYHAVTEPFIRSVVDGGSLAWVENVVNGTKERERLLWDAEGYVLNVDTKWKSHPPMTPDDDDAREDNVGSLYHHEAVRDLYCLVLVKDGRDIRTLRDLRRRHVPLLRSMVTDAPAVVERVYGVSRDRLRVFCHYQPQFYHFHVHLTRLHNDSGCQVERGHLLTDVIQNLQADDSYYARRTISYKLPTHDALYQRIQAYRENADASE